MLFKILCPLMLAGLVGCAASRFGGKRCVYINAFRNFTGGNSESSEDWKHKAVIACDGGNYFWGALYDPETREFSDLSANGRI